MHLVSALGESPWGPLRIAAHDGAVVAVELLSTAEGFAAGLARRRLPTPMDVGAAAPGPAAAMARRVLVLLEAALRGEPVDLTAIPIHITDRPAWDRLVLGAVRAIPRSSVASYGEVARRIGRPGAARAVGGAVGRNPVGLLVPCHRVIAGDGTIGGYGATAWGGYEAAIELKRALLAIEGTHLRDGVSPMRHPGCHGDDGDSGGLMA